MAPRKFDRYMVQVGMGAHPKLACLTDSEFRAHVVGVLAIAATAPTRGYLLVGATPAEPIHIAALAGVSKRVAASAMAKLLAVGILYHDDELACLRVHDWDDYQPEPRGDLNGSRRQALYRDDTLRLLIRTRDGNRCRYCNIEVEWRDRRGPKGATYDHLDPSGPNAEWNLVVACRACNAQKGGRTPETAGMTLLPARGSTADLLRIRKLSTPEVEVEEEDAKASSRRGASADDKATRDDIRLCALLRGLAEERNPKFKVKSRGRWLTDMRLLRDRDKNTPEDIERAIRWLFTDSFWSGVIQSPGNLREHFSQIWGKMTAPGSAATTRPVEGVDSFLARTGGR